MPPRRVLADDLPVMLTTAQDSLPPHGDSRTSTPRAAVVLAKDATVAAPVMQSCGELSVTAYLATSIGEAGSLLAEHAPQVFVVALDGFDAVLDAPGIGALVAMAEPEKSLVLCPQVRMLFLLDLFRRGLDHYTLSPCLPGRLSDALRARLSFEAPAAVLELDDSGKIIETSDACTGLLAPNRDQILGHSLADFFETDGAAHLQHLQVALRHGEAGELAVRLCRNDGRVFDAAVKDASRRNPDGSLSAIRLEVRDLDYYLARKRRVTHQLSAERELHALVTVRAKIQQALIGLKDVNELALLLCNELDHLPGVAAATFYKLESAGVMRAAAHVGTSDCALGAPGVELDALFSGAPGNVMASVVFAGELALFDAATEPDASAARQAMHHMKAKGVLMVPILADSVMFDEAAQAVGCLVIYYADAHPLARDFLEAFAEFGTLASFGLRLIALNHEKTALLSRMQAMAMSDMLTGAANRRHGIEFLEACVGRAAEKGEPVSLVMVDIDKFKRINDEYGHAMGDEVLKAVTRVVSGLIREGDLLVRWGGEEFLIIAPGIDADDTAEIADSIRIAISRTAIPGCHQVTASFGISQIDSPDKVEDAMNLADQALYAAKEGGRNQVVVSTD
jgi:diguanylate cyclase (GGDEF)-like protein